MIAAVIEIFILLTVIDALISFAPRSNIHRHPLVMKLRLLVDIPQKPIRQMFPGNFPFDPSPLIVILGLRILLSFF
jgi:uncharacterized protein YggT (Ycf19 family)